MQGANFIPKSDFGNCPFGRNLPQFSPGALSDGGNGPPSLPLARQLEEWPTADDKNPNKIQPGETEPGIYQRRRTYLAGRLRELQDCMGEILPDLEGRRR